MTKRALDAYGFERTVGFKEPGESEDGIRLQQSRRDGLIVEIDFPPQEAVDQIGCQSVNVHFQSGRQGILWADPRANSTEFGSFDGQVELQHVPPERLVADP